MSNSSTTGRRTLKHLSLAGLAFFAAFTAASADGHKTGAADRPPSPEEIERSQDPST